MSTHVTFQIHLSIHDAEAFRAAAITRAGEDGLTEWEPETLADCAVMLLDPGESPPGSSIESSEADELPFGTEEN